MVPRRLRAWLRLQTQKLLSSWGLLFRISFCFAVGLAMLITTRQGNYDTRFALRGPQVLPDDIVIIHLNREDVLWMEGLSESNSKNVIWSLKEIVETSDSFFWHPNVWERALSKVSQARPLSIAVTLFFGDETVRGTLTNEQQGLFQRLPLFWAAKSDTFGHAILPGLARPAGQNVGAVDLRSDPDGKIRHFLSMSISMPHLAVKIANHAFRNQGKNFSPFSHIGKPINFQGPQGTFKSFSFSDLLRNKIKPAELEGKIVLIGVKDIPAHEFQTPLGVISDAEILANLVHNFLHNRWIVEIPFWLGVLYLLLVIRLTLWIIFEYPQLVAFVFLSFLSVSIAALSAAFFDLLAIWIPVGAPLATILVTYVVITSYRLSETERLSWESERELHYLSEVESLKNNFLSLISHDLKNPIAKIQGIADRILSGKDTSIPEQLKEDLGSIKGSSEELRQYITSILQLTRVEARDIKLTKEVCDINAIVSDVMERLRDLANNKQIRIQTTLDPLFSMEVDRTLITEVLINLIENAIKYSDTGGEVLITTQEVGTEVKVQVVDYAGGIPEEEVTKVFEKFYRGSGEKTRRVTGTGLGLYLVKYFIELHGGKVFINSRIGEGTTVGFTLPLEAEENYADFTRSHR
jgi:two-component system, OmpR family, phosphate regulon sensor histidine kinase PhoR